jgi:hypothetical protein
MKLIKYSMFCGVTLLMLCAAVAAQSIVLSKADVHIPKGQRRMFDFGLVLQSDATNLLVNKTLFARVAESKPYKWSDNQAWRVLYASSFRGVLK